MSHENQQIGSFRLLHLIGTGAMGEVWLGEDTRNARNVAVRILPRANPEMRVRLTRALSLHHPSIADVIAVEEQNGCLFVVMEFVDAPPLTTAMRARTLSDSEIVHIARDVAEALAVAHEHGIVHGHLEPDDVRVNGSRVKVLDFGLRQASASADLFSLGVLLHQALTGTEARLAILGNAPNALISYRPDLPSELADVITRCLGRGYTSARELAAALEYVRPWLSRVALPVTPTLPVSTSPFAGKRILIADDDAAIRRLFETVAKRQRIDCDTVANGSEAIAALKEREYALIFLDIMMPRIDGWGVLDFLRTRRDTRLPKLFIVTAFLDQTVSTADSEIVDGIIYKPIDADDIAALMREGVRGGNTAGTLQRTRHRLIGAA